MDIQEVNYGNSVSAIDFWYSLILFLLIALIVLTVFSAS